MTPTVRVLPDAAAVQRAAAEEFAARTEAAARPTIEDQDDRRATPTAPWLAGAA